MMIEIAGNALGNCLNFCWSILTILSSFEFGFNGKYFPFFGL
jgi:hypothetical protein